MVDQANLETTPLHALHHELGARMVGFSGYDMPLQYPAGILREHLHVRRAAGLFDVSHMGQVRLRGANVAAALERLVPADIQGLQLHCSRYTVFTNEAAGIIDDLIVTKFSDETLGLIVNAGGKHADVAHLKQALPAQIDVQLFERGLIALQGPLAASVLASHVPGIAGLGFMQGTHASLFGIGVYITRSGYTGEDGFEISIANEEAELVVRRLLGEPNVLPIGLGARDLLRLEAGLCLYGHDIDTSTTPVEAGLAWSIGRQRRTSGGFAGDKIILRQLRDGPPRRRVGILPDGRTPAREGAAIEDQGGASAGMVTSGGFSPSLERPIAMGYVPAALAKTGTACMLMVRDREIAATVTPLPFVPHRYHSKGSST